MIKLKRPHPLLFLSTFALLGFGVYAAIVYLGGAGLGSFVMILGVVASAFWYGRRTQYAAVALFAVVCLPPLLRLNLPPLSFWLFYVSAVVIQVVMVEAIYRQVRASAANLALKEAAEARLKFLISHSPMVTYTLRLEPQSQSALVCNWITENIVDLTGYTSVELLESPTLWTDRVHPDDRQSLWNPEQIGTGGRPARTEYRFTHRDGREIWIENNSKVIRDASDRFVEVIGKLHDITIRKAAQVQVEEDRRFINELATAVPSELSVVDLATRRVVYANRPDHDLASYRDGQAVIQQAAVRKNLHPDDRPLMEKSLAALPGLLDGETLTTDLRFGDPAVGWRDVQVRHRVFKRDAGGRVTQVISVREDLTAMRAAERALAASQKTLSRIAETLPHMIYVLDATRSGAVPTYANRSIHEHLGFTDDYVRELGRQRFFDQVAHPDDRAAVAAAIASSPDVSGQEGPGLTFRLKNVHGTWRWLHLRTLPLSQDAEGRATQLLGVVEDITESRELQETIRKDRDYVELILNTLGQGVVVLDPEGISRYANPAACHMLGIEAGAALGLRLSDLLPRDQRPAIHSQIMQGLARERTFSFEMPYVRPDGVKLNVLVVASPWLQNGRLVSVVSVITDLTEQKTIQHTLETVNEELDQALTRAKALALEAQSATRAKSDFLAHMSHEIRTPMNAILGMAEILQGSRLDAQQRDSVQIINESSQGLLAIINDILDFSKIEAGRVTLDPHPFNLTTAVESTVDLLALRARGKGLRLSSFVDPAIPETLVGDAGRLRQILANLVSNAVKFTEHGHVAIWVVPEPAAADVIGLRITVQDTGIGIAPEALGRLFQPFEQAERDTTRRYGGTGLGLAIVKRLVDLMGGEIRVESQVHVGTTLTLSVPFALSPETQGDPERQTAPGKRVLICEPDPIVRDVLSRYTEAAGSTCFACADPASVWMHLQPGHPYDAIILGLAGDGDDVMPGVRARLSADPAFRHLPRIEVIDAGQKPVGATAVVVRPIKRAQLEEALYQAFAPQAGRADVEEVFRGQVAEPAAPTGRPGLRILLAEDNPINQKVAVLQLEKLGCEVEIAVDGQAAVEAYRAAPERYALILMDCQMPVLDGFAATRVIRAWEADQGLDRHIRVVAMTANALAGDREACLTAGMDDYLSKPVSRKALEQVLEAAFA